MKSMATIALQLPKFLALEHQLKSKSMLNVIFYFGQNVKTNSAAVKRYQEFLSSKKKAQVLVTHAAEQQNYQQSLSPKKETQISCNNADAHRKQHESLPPKKRLKFYKLMLMHIKKTRISFT
jgi:hypothetical protein